MYCNFFGCQEKPFKLVPNPDFLYLSKSHRSALAHLNYARNHSEGFVVITGEVGTGKTTLCRSFLERLDEKADSAYIFNPVLDSVELLTAICNEFGLRAEVGDMHRLLERLHSHLIAKNAQGRKVILLIDEAQNLSSDNLEMVLRLSNLDAAGDKLLQIIMVGQSELRDTLDCPELQRLAQCISLNTHLSPLNEQETIGYIHHRIRIAAQRPLTLFTHGACRAIYRCTNGIPRLVNIVCDRALLLAYSRDRVTVNASIAKSAILEVAGRRRPLSGRALRGTAAMASAGLALLIAAGAFAFQTGRLPSGGYWFDRAASSGMASTVNGAMQGLNKQSPMVTIEGHEMGGGPIKTQPAASESVNHTAVKPVSGAHIAMVAESLAHHDSYSDAVKRILEAWQWPDTHPPDWAAGVSDQEYFEIAARQHNLRSYPVNADWTLVRQLDLPVIMALRPPGIVQDVYMVLTRWEEGDMVELCGTGGIPLRTHLGELMPYLQGTAFVYWKDIFGIEGLVNTAAPDTAIILLKALLRLAGYAPIEDAPVFDAHTRRLVMDFQQRHHLTPDGLVGPLTKMVLTREAGTIEVPRLSKDESGGDA